jgi:hypothetical protein
MSASPTPELVRATISVTLDNEREVMAVNAWLNRWGPRLQLSDQQGCGCCVDIWDVQAPRQALTELPAAMVRQAGDGGAGAAAPAAL